MIWHLTIQLALYLFILPIFAMFGYQRGWRREVFLWPFVGLAAFFLYLNLGKNLAQFVLQLILDRPVTDPSEKTLLIFTILGMVVILGTGYLLGNRMFPKPGAGQDRVLGMFAALPTGFLAVYYLTNVIFPSTRDTLIGQGSLQVDQLHIGAYVLVLFIILAVVLVVRLVVASTGKKK
ncbi:MAG: CvpA family protein [Ktedonobacteraceae bacterium]|nr:CvpA family protein [Ktedonobacteraceae bacterium]